MSELPDDTIQEAERLTRLAGRVVDRNEAEAYREERDRLLAEYGFVARVRSEETRDVLVFYPDEWVEDDAVRTDRIEDLSRAVERTLSGPDDEDRWEEVDAHNRELVAEIDQRADAVHAANADAFADFMANHYVRPMESATPAEVREFLTEYFPRNAWPTARQKAAVEESLRVVFRVAGREPPGSLGD